ncbi:MAG TPA: hypothetical protein VH186_12895 [Chloroflexia bacterium]|nr:hypothetical protein [Chloroflexia bacterium]
MSKRVLITTVEAGGGHVSVMNSLYKTLSVPAARQIKLVKYYSPQQSYDKIYRVLARFPLALEFLHYSSIRLVRWFKSLVMLPEMPGAKKVLKETNPDVVICTHPFQSLVFGNLRKKLNLKYKIVTCICDYGDPKEYIEYAPEVDYYLVRDESTLQEATKYSQPESIFIFGTVVNEVFEKYGHASDGEVESDFRRFFQETFPEKMAEFDPAKPNLLVVGGSGWVRKSRRLIERMAKTGKYNLLVCCGKDEPLKEELKDLPGVFCFGFISQDQLALVERYVDAAVLSTLAPATMYELLTINKYPLFVHRYHARQEAPHIRLLSDWKIGFHEPNDQKMMKLLDDYLNNRPQYQEYIDNAAKRCAEEKKKASENYKFLLEI